MAAVQGRGGVGRGTRRPHAGTRNSAQRRRLGSVTDWVPEFANHLRELMQRPRPDGRRWSDRALAQAAADLGHDLSASYVRQLRTGIRANPSLEIVRTLTEVLGVPAGYFYDTDQTDALIQALRTLQAAGAQAILTSGEGHIPPETLRRIAQAIDQDPRHRARLAVDGKDLAANSTPR